jgi:hypothetical protein
MIMKLADDGAAIAAIMRLLRTQPGEYFFLSSKNRKGGDWQEHPFHRDELNGMPAFVDEHLDRNLYFCPHGFRRPHRRKVSAVLPCLLCADMDGVSPFECEPEPTGAIETSPGRYSGWWCTDRPVTEQLNKRLTYFNDFDHGGWDLTQILRLPGSYNYKYDPPAKAHLLWADGKRYAVSDLEKRLPPLPQNDTPAYADKRLIIGHLQEDWRAILRRRRAWLFVTVTSPVAVGKRSDVIWKIGMILREKGATPNEVASVLQAARCWRDKHGDNRQALQDEVRRIFDKPLRSAP